MKKLAGIIGWVGTGLVFAAVAVRFIKPDLEWIWRGLVWAGLACVLLYAAGQWREIAGAFSRRQARFGALATASVLIVLGILAAVNYVSARENKRWDLTTTKQFS